ASGTKDPMGADEKDAAIRLAYDFPWFTIGGFYVDGSVGGDLLGGNAASTVDYSRTGIDFQVEQGNLYIQGMYMDAKDDVYDPVNDVITGDQSNAAYYIQGFYVINAEGDTPIVPLLRYQSVESNDGNDSVDSIVANVTAYIRQNINVSLEYWKETSVPTGQAKNDRKTLLFNIVF
ncbi:MAG: hypothetical protein D6718_11410, partial [Acidobacteria bacterium]